MTRNILESLCSFVPRASFLKRPPHISQNLEKRAACISKLTHNQLIKFSVWNWNKILINQQGEWTDWTQVFRSYSLDRGYYSFCRNELDPICTHHSRITTARNGDAKWYFIPVDFNGNLQYEKNIYLEKLRREIHIAVEIEKLKIQAQCIL